ncbi:hypothetical protein B0H21DRAFT_723150 [Amylocystis lapponica]|nr:hypothetical protein B0H21DRAFT_723150 [Amylocystis lapponica]
MYPKALRLVVVSLETGSIVCLLVLLATPASKHAIVKALVVATILRSLFDILPPLIYEQSAQVSNYLTPYSSFAQFCIADVIILRYFTVVKATFPVIFTVPCLSLALKHSMFGSARRLTTEEASNPFSRRTIILFCIGPFVWALPTIFIPMHKLMQDQRTLQPAIENTTTCCIADGAFQVVSLVLMLIPLVVSIIAGMALVLTLCQYCYGFARQAVGWQPVRVIRFTALIATTITSAILYTIVLVGWVRFEYDHQGKQAVSATLAMSTVWEAIHPWTILFIFAREEVYAQWTTWLRKFVTFGSRRSRQSDGIALRWKWGYADSEQGDEVRFSDGQGYAGNFRSSDTSQFGQYESKIADRDALGTSAQHMEGDLRGSFILKHITSKSTMRTAVDPPSPTIDGLPLPPRTVRCKGESLHEVSIRGNLRAPPTVPDIGRNPYNIATASNDSHSEYGGCTGEGGEVEAQRFRSAWYPSTPCSRSRTSGSTGTFGTHSQEF